VKGLMSGSGRSDYENSFTTVLRPVTFASSFTTHLTPILCYANLLPDFSDKQYTLPIQLYQQTKHNAISHLTQSC